MEGKIYTIGGKELEMFTLGVLAKCLDRDSQTVRKWELNGIIPQATYRSASNHRLYTRRQIEAIVQCVRKHNIRAGLPITQAFKDDVKEAFERATQADFEEDYVSSEEG